MKTIGVLASLAAIAAAVVLADQNPTEPAPPPPPPDFPHFEPTPYEKDGADRSFKIVRPTVFLMLRTPSIWKSGSNRPIVQKMVDIVNRARAAEFGYDPDFIDPWTENILILEEPNCWVVAFQERGNGMGCQRQEPGYVGWGIERIGNEIYYLSMDTFELIAPPAGTVVRIPATGVLGEYMFPTKYPDENVDSFVSLEEVMSAGRPGNAPEAE